jgi:thiol:disulfide interchange protein DsbA
VNRILALALVLVITAGCGQAQDTTASTAPAAAEPTAVSQTETAAAQDNPSESEPAPAETTAGTTADANPSTEAAGTTQLAQADLSAVEAAGFVEGLHYSRISPVQPTGASPGKIEVDEFFMHSCPHCYNLEPYVQAWLQDKPDYIDFVRVPVTWDAYRQLHAAAWYAAETLGIDEEINLPFFREIHDSGNMLDSPAKLAALFERFDVSSDDFEDLMGSFAVITKVNRANELQSRYRIQSTPSIVVNGKYKTGVDMAGSPEQLFELIEALAAAELGR